MNSDNVRFMAIMLVILICSFGNKYSAYKDANKITASIENVRNDVLILNQELQRESDQCKKQFSECELELNQEMSDCDKELEDANNLYKAVDKLYGEYNDTGRCNCKILEEDYGD